MGTVNFGDEVFSNPWPFIVELYRAARDAEVVPEFELFDLGHVAALLRRHQIELDHAAAGGAIVDGIIRNTRSSVERH